MKNVNGIFLSNISHCTPPSRLIFSIPLSVTHLLDIRPLAFVARPDEGLGHLVLDVGSLPDLDIFLHFLAAKRDVRYLAARIRFHQRRHELTQGQKRGQLFNVRYIWKTF